MTNRKPLSWIPAVVCMAAIFVLSSMPTLPPPPGIGGLDKLEHYIAYAVLSILVFIASRKTWTGFGPCAVMAVSVVITALYGMTDEFHQRFVPNRCCDVFDWTADLLGAITGVVLAAGVAFLFRKRKLKDTMYRFSAD
ncbi:MAG: VanZ family protein [Armatimonadota bacterium]